MWSENLSLEKTHVLFTSKLKHQISVTIHKGYEPHHAPNDGFKYLFDRKYVKHMVLLLT